MEKDLTMPVLDRVLFLCRR